MTAKRRSVGPNTGSLLALGGTVDKSAHAHPSLSQYIYIYIHTYTHIHVSVKTICVPFETHAYRIIQIRISDEAPDIIFMHPKSLSGCEVASVPFFHTRMTSGLRFLSPCSICSLEQKWGAPKIPWI